MSPIVRLLQREVSAGLLVLLTLAPSTSLAGQQIWLMAGQSNSIGWGTVTADLPAALQQPQPDVKIFTESTSVWSSLAPGYGNEFGPELTFGRDMAAGQPGVDVLLVKATFGLGNLYDNWRSPNTGRGSAGEHYTNFIALAQAALALKPDAQIAGMIWMQGEGDGYDDLTMATSYASNLGLFISSLRNDLDSPDMPFVLGQISDSDAWAYGGIVQQAQAEVAQTVSNCYMVATSDLPLSDNMHYTSQGQTELGSRFARQALTAIETPEPNAIVLFSSGLLCLLAYARSGLKRRSGLLLLAVFGFCSWATGAEPARTRATEDWPTWHVTALPEEGRCQPYDPNGCIFWKGKYHLMYIFQNGAPGHSWGHAASTDLVNWTYYPPAIMPEPGDPGKGTFSGNAFVNKAGKPMLCWFGIDAGVCVATAADGDKNLIRWKKHPKNPIIPVPKPGEPGHGVYKVWDPYLWLEGDNYYCLLGGNQLPNGKDALYLMKSPDLVNWTPVHPFYEHTDLSWTKSCEDPDIFKSEDCSCPDFFQLGDKHVLLCISHMIGARCYVGRYEKERFYPEQHARMNWPGGACFAPESLVDAKGRRIFWTWAIDPRIGPTRNATGSGAMTMPRVLSLDADNSLHIAPAAELQSLRRNHRTIGKRPLADNAEMELPDIRGDSMELALEIDPGRARQVGVKVRCSHDGKEETAIVYDTAAKTLTLDMSQSTSRTDVVYCGNVLETVFRDQPREGAQPVGVVVAPLVLRPGETLKLRVFLDKPMLEAFANGRQCVTQQIFPASREALGVKLFARGGAAMVRSGAAWEMVPARFVDHKTAR